MKREGIVFPLEELAQQPCRLGEMKRETMGPLGAVLPVEPEPSLTLEQARTHAAQIIISRIEKQSGRSIYTLVGWLSRIGHGESLAPNHPFCLDADPHGPMSTNWEN